MSTKSPACRCLGLLSAAFILLAAWAVSARAAEASGETSKIISQEIALTPDVLAMLLQPNKISGLKPVVASANTADCGKLFESLGVLTGPEESIVLHTDTGKLVVRALPSNIDLIEGVLETQYGRKSP